MSLGPQRVKAIEKVSRWIWRVRESNRLASDTSDVQPLNNRPTCGFWSPPLVEEGVGVLPTVSQSGLGRESHLRPALLAEQSKRKNPKILTP